MCPLDRRLIADLDRLATAANPVDFSGKAYADCNLSAMTATSRR
jgi:hypothetical protein